MKQYLELLKSIKKDGTYKPAARAGMPGTQSLFGHQFRHNLADGFPLLTTKKMFFKGVVVELLWFLRGDTNVKYLIDNGVNIWNEDAYNFYLKECKKCDIVQEYIYSFDEFVNHIKLGNQHNIDGLSNEYILGDCGYQYGRVWRKWTTEFDIMEQDGSNKRPMYCDQIAGIINSLKKSPESRRHIITAVDPGHDQDLALYWCHSLFQFNCRPISVEERNDWIFKNCMVNPAYKTNLKEHELDQQNVPKYFLDCQLYQRSCDVFLGGPINTASYSLLTHIFCKICNMLPGHFIHTFGDVHIYDDHNEAVNMQLTREPRKLPNLKFSDNFHKSIYDFNQNILSFDDMIGQISLADFIVENYDPHPTIKAKLSTGLK